MTLKVAGIGAGYFAQYHYDAWQRIGEIRLEAVCDLDASRAQSTAERHGIPTVFTDVDAMIREIQPDILDIITPPDSHEVLIQGQLLFARNHWPQTPLQHTGWLSRRKQINHFLLSTRTSVLNLGTEKFVICSTVKG